MVWWSYCFVHAVFIVIRVIRCFYNYFKVELLYWELFNWFSPNLEKMEKEQYLVQGKQTILLAFSLKIEGRSLLNEILIF